MITKYCSLFLDIVVQVILDTRLQDVDTEMDISVSSQQTVKLSEYARHFPSEPLQVKVLGKNLSRETRSKRNLVNVS